MSTQVAPRLAFDPTAATLGVSEAQADSTAGDVAMIKTDFNTLIGKLRAAGILKP